MGCFEGVSVPHQCPLGKLAMLPSLYTDVRSILMVLCCFHRTATNETTIHVMLMLARMSIGFGVGIICCSVNAYQVELSTLKLRGAIGTMFQFGIVIGIFVTYLVRIFFYQFIDPECSLGKLAMLPSLFTDVRTILMTSHIIQRSVRLLPGKPLV